MIEIPKFIKCSKCKVHKHLTREFPKDNPSCSHAITLYCKKCKKEVEIIIPCVGPDIKNKVKFNQWLRKGQIK